MFFLSVPLAKGAMQVVNCKEQWGSIQYTHTGVPSPSVSKVVPQAALHGKGIHRLEPSFHEKPHAVCALSSAPPTRSPPVRVRSAKVALTHSIYSDVAPCARDLRRMDDWKVAFAEPWDAVVLGTGMKECLLSGLLSVAGKKSAPPGP